MKMDSDDDVDRTPDWDTETAFELAMGWHDEAEKIALENAAQAEKRGHKDGAASWRKIAGIAAQIWADNKDKIRQTGPNLAKPGNASIAAELLKPYQIDER